MVAERPIIFSTLMVQAILAGKKTQTRRVIDKDIVYGFDIDVDGSICAYLCQTTGDSYRPEDVAPYRPDDILWVRETWTEVHGGIFYRADIPDSVRELMVPHGAVWRSPMHLRRKNARLFLRVKNVRAERLQDITEDDAQAEGFTNNIQLVGEDDYIGRYATERFWDAWDSLNAKRGHPWDANPWVWVIEFEVIDNARDSTQTN